MTSDDPRWMAAAIILATTGSLLFLGACEERNSRPAGPEQSPDFYHADGLQDDETADAVQVIEDNISGDGSEVCNDSRVQDTGVVGDNEGTWLGQKIDPAEDSTNNGFAFDLKGKKSVSWTDDGKNLMQAVLIKAGSKSVIYYYNEGEPNAEPDPVADFSDNKLDGEDNKDISYYAYCFVEQPAVKRGIKFRDTDVDGELDAGEDSLPGWEIRAYADNGDGTLSEAEFNAGPVATTTTAADGTGRLEKGEYEFFLDPGDYVICEVEKDGWNQSSRPSSVANWLDDACEAGDGLGEGGYAISLSAGEIDDGNHFANNQSTIEVTVEDQDGNLVPGHTVVATHSDNGPYRSDETLRSGVTDGDGFTVIGNLEPGTYCVRSSPLRIPSELVVPTSDHLEDPDLADNLGTAITGTVANSDEKRLTLSNFKEECGLGTDDTKPSIQPGDELTLTLQAPAGKVNGTVESFEKDDPEFSAWMVADLPQDALPQDWIDNIPSTSVADVKLGLFVTAADDDGTTEFTIETPGGEAVIELDKVPLSPSIQTGGASTTGTDDVGTITTEPLFCQLNQVGEPADDGDEVELKGPYKHGFLANAKLELLEDKFGISYAQTAGEAKLKVRAKSKNTKRLVVQYKCEADGTCNIEKTSGSLANRVDVLLGSVGTNRVRFVIDGLPSGIHTVLSGVSTSGDQIPNSSKDENNDGLVEASLPKQCKTGGSTWQLGAD